MRIDLRITQNRRDTIFKPLRDEVFEPVCFLVYFVPGVFENVVEKQFQQTMMPDQFPRPPFSRRREPDTVVLFIQHKCRTLGRKLLKHPCYRRGPHAEPLG